MYIFRFSQFLRANRYKLFAIFLISGLFLCFFGFQVFSFAIFLIGTLIGTLACGLFLFERTGFDTPEWGLWLIFTVSVILGCGVGYIAYKLEGVGFVILGLALGLVGGLAFFAIVLAPLVKGSVVAFYVCIGLLSLLGGLIAYKTWK